MKTASREDLEPIEIPEPAGGVPAEMIALADDASARIDSFHESADGIRIPAFVPSNPRFAYGLLASVVARGLATGPRFCEWGSGFGTVACIAAYLGLSAHGIEIDPALVDEARRLARDHHLSVKFHLGSYKPEGLYQETVDPDRLDAGLGFSPLDFDLIYAYPWPAEERAVTYLFREFAGPGTLLILYHGGVRYRIFRKPTLKRCDIPGKR